MNSLMMRVVVTGLVAAVTMQCVIAQNAYVVGDSLGWGIPSNGAAAYTSWASGKQFLVGDILIFNFGTNQHDVQQVQKDSFDACTSTNPIGDSIANGPANITLTSSGDHYYICTFGRHCLAGQKLAITVSSTSTGAAPPTTSTPTPPAIPSPTSNTPSDAACSPTTSSSGMPPAVGGPRASTRPEAGDSSSPAVFASFFVTLLSISMALLF